MEEVIKCKNCGKMVNRTVNQNCPSCGEKLEKPLREVEGKKVQTE